MFRVIAVLICTALLLAACSDRAPIDPVRVATNKAAIEQCRHNYSKCGGGFFVWQSTGEITRIDDVHESRAPSTIGAGGLVQNMDLGGEQYLNWISVVILPDDPRWNDFAVRYAEQFVAKK